MKPLKDDPIWFLRRRSYNVLAPGHLEVIKFHLTLHCRLLSTSRWDNRLSISNKIRMPQSSSSNSHSRLPRSPEEPRRRKRYSLRIEFLDDDEDDELDRVREMAERRGGRSVREASAVRNRDRVEPDRSRAGDRRSRRTSTSSTAAVVGSRPPPPSSPERQQEARQPDVGQLSEGVDRMSLIHHDEAALPELLEQMSIHERERNTRRERPSSNEWGQNATTQTSIRGYDPYSASTPPPPRRPSARGQRPRDRSVESAYLDGFLRGRQLVNATGRPPQQSPFIIRMLCCGGTGTTEK